MIIKMGTIKRSKELERKGSKFMPSGAADSIFINNARGSHIWDVDGNEYTIISWVEVQSS